jgi:hypothetical protein
MSMYPDEQTVVIDGEEVSYPGLLDGKFSSGDFSDPSKKPSFIPAETINLILDNLSALITAAGGEPNNAGAAQLVGALSSAATAKKIMQRDDNGRASIAAPVNPGEIARLADARPPINSTYVQFPNLSDPATLWPGTTWTNISSSYPGAFFRAEGGNAQAFAGQASAQANQNKEHVHGGATGNDSPDHTHSNRGGTTIASVLNNGSTPCYIGGTEATGGASTRHTHPISSDGGPEARPDNWTIRIWKRTA